MSNTRGIRDDHTLTYRDRTVRLLGPHAASFTLAWLATHRDRLHGLILGGHRLSVLVIYDSKGRTRVPHSDAELSAIATIVYGDVAA